MVLRPLDVGQYPVLPRFGIRHHTHGDARDRFGNGDARIHERQRAGADRGHRGRTVACQAFADDADGVRELFFIGDDGAQRLLRQRAVAYHAAVHPADPAGFADGKRGEVVVQHNALLAVLHLYTIDDLRGLRSAERQRAEHVRRSAIKEPCAVYHRRDAAGFSVERADFIHRAAVDALAFFNREVMHIFIETHFKVCVDLSRVGVGELLNCFFYPLAFHCADFILAEKAAMPYKHRLDNCREGGRNFRAVLRLRKWSFFDTALFNYFFLPSLYFFYFG